MAEICESDVKAALRAMRHGGQLDQSPLLRLDAVVDFCHNQGQPIHAETLEWALGQILTQLVFLQLVRFDPSRSTSSPAEQLACDFGAGDMQREAWSALYHRYLSPEHLTVAALSRLAGVDAKLFDRRRAKGVERLTEALRTHEARIDVDGASSTRLGLPAPRGDAGAQGDADHPVGDLDEYRHSRVHAWQSANEQLDRRFVELSLLLDQGQDGPNDRWTPIESRFHDLSAVLSSREEAAFVLLGAPGSGKTTLLRHLEMDYAREGLTDDGQPIALFQSLAACHGRHAKDRPDPGAWLEAQWSRRYPELPGLDRLADEGAILLLDGLNELPHVDAVDFRTRLLLWKAWLHDFIGRHPRSRVVFACRTLDYSAPLSSPETPVPHIRVEDLDPDRARQFLQKHHPAMAAQIWEELEASHQFDLTRSPYYLRLVVDAVVATGEVPSGRAVLFTELVRRSLRRELKRDNPRLLDLRLLDERDLMRIIHARKWSSPYELPDRGPLIGALSRLAYTLQRNDFHGESRQVRSDWDAACQKIAPMPESILHAGIDLGLLDDDRERDELFFRHQLIQEYFAARALTRKPAPELARSEWRAEHMCPSIDEVIDDLAPADPLPALPGTGWEETMFLAAEMSRQPDKVLRGLMETNLPLAGRTAAQSELLQGLSVKLLNELRWALVERSRKPEADLRDRIACGYAVGDLGDPRLERRIGPVGAYLMPPLITIASNLYRIGCDEVVEWSGGRATDHVPCHQIELREYRIAVFPTTNAEWACFMATGGYEDEQWWDTETSSQWRQGSGTAAGARWGVRYWLGRFKTDSPVLQEHRVAAGWSEKTLELWQSRLSMSEAELDEHLQTVYPDTCLTQPAYWQSANFNRPSQPVVGVSWYEARAYCRWLSAQSGLDIRLPTEVEWEAAARGTRGRRYAYGARFDRLKCNALETKVRRPTPVGVFPEGDTPSGATDLTGNIYEWTSTAWDIDGVPLPYPYDPGDGREDCDLGIDSHRVVRGGSWGSDAQLSQNYLRRNPHPCARMNGAGFRVVATDPLNTDEHSECCNARQDGSSSTSRQI